MKKLLALCLAVMVLSVPSFAEETDVTGDWYGDFMGAVMKMTFNEDGTYVLDFAGEIQEGTWERTDEGIMMDDETAGLLTQDGLEFGYGEEMNMVFGRDVIEAFVPAEIDYEAPLDVFQGKWSAYKVGTDGAYMNVAPGDMSYMEMEISDKAVTMDGFYFDHETYELEMQDGGLSRFTDDESEMFEIMAVNYLEDGTVRLALVISVEDNNQLVYLFVPAGEEEGITEAVTE